ncbi:MAG TPA: hypothetical protein VJS44_08375 [Pyrinomonadaceae bacterium]|nr:hypothetical protein [Pyrinomonadaceae bacterium]
MSEQVIDQPIEPPAPAADPFSFLDDYVPDSTDIAQTPLPDDAAVEASADKQEQPIEGESPAAGEEKREGEAQAKPGEAAPEQSADDDPDLTPEENEAVRSRPKAEQPELVRKLKAAKFEDHFKNPDKNQEEVRQYLESQSPSQYRKLEEAFIEHRVSRDPVEFAAYLYEKNPEAYGKLVVAAFNSDPAFFLSKATGRAKKDLTPELVKQAVEAIEGGKTLTSESAAKGKVSLTDEEWESLTDFQDAETVEKIKLLASAQPVEEKKPAEAENPPKEKEQPKPEEKTDDAPKVDPEKVSEAWVTAEAPIVTYLDGKLDEEYGLTVSEKERELAPDVADLKDMKRSILLDGLRGALPPFRSGFSDWAKEQQKAAPDSFKAYQENLVKMLEFAERGEGDNAAIYARKLFPLIDRYMAVRAKHPAVERLTRRIEQAAQGQSKPPEGDTFIPPGAPSLSQQGAGSDPWAFLNK